MPINHKAKLVENITKLMALDSFNDVKIRLTNGVQVEANKVIIAATSTFFKNKLQEQEKSGKGDRKFLEIEIDISSTKEMMELVKKYLYTGELEFESLELKDLIDLIHLILFLELHELAKEVEPFILKKINDGGFSPEKIMILSSTAEAYGLNNVVSSMLNHLDEKINDVSKLPEVQYLNSDFLLQLIDVERENLHVHDHFGLNDSGYQPCISSIVASIDYAKLFPKFVTLASWLSGKSDVDETLKARLISMFDLRRFTNQQLTTTVRESRLFSDSSILDVVSQSVNNLEQKVEKLKDDKMSNKRKFEIELLAEKKNGLNIQNTLDRIKEENKRLRKSVKGCCFA